MIKIVGLDISMNNLGVCKATIDEFGKLTITEVDLIQPDKADAATKKQVRKNSDDLRRFRWLHDKLHEAIKGADILSIEMPVGSQSARAMVSYAGCIGVLSSIPMPFIEVTPAEVKLAGFGVKTATKHEMIEWAVAKHPEIMWRTMNRAGKKVIKADNEHIADAAAAIYAAMKTDQFKTSVAFAKSMMNTMKNAA